MTREEIAMILKNLRLSSGFTQKEVAEKLKKKQQTIASWESAQSQPDANTLFTLCALYKTSVDKAFGFSANSKVNVNAQKLLDIFSNLSEKYQSYILLMSQELLSLQEQKKEGE